MKLTIQIILIAGVMLVLIGLFLTYGFSDFTGSPVKGNNIWETKPWRPFARLGLGFFLTSFTLIMGGALIRVSFRGR